MGTRRGCEQVLVQGTAPLYMHPDPGLLLLLLLHSLRWTLRDQGRLISFFISLGR